MGGLETGAVLLESTAPEVEYKFLVKKELLDDGGRFFGMPKFVKDVIVHRPRNKQLRKDGWMIVSVVSKDVSFVLEDNLKHIRCAWDEYEELE